MANILSTTNSALVAAQQGLATTAHNIANARTEGYHRQVVLQSAVSGQNEGGGFIGKGTEVVSVRRVYNEYLGTQLRTVQTSQGQLDSHYTQASRINNMLADPNSGLSPVLQDFFQSVQNLAANPDARGSMLASSQSLASRFQSMDGQLRELRVSVNSEISTTISAINSYAEQIANLNEAISKAQSGSGQMPNDLLDQRDHLVAELSKLTKVTVSKDGSNYGVFIGNGQPMVVGSTVSKLDATASPTDLSEVAVGLVTSKGTVRLSEDSLQGGKLGGLFEFRSTTLTNTQNQLGRIAVGLAATFNDQHKLGKDRTGAMGGDFFNMAKPLSVRSNLNSGTAMVDASITDVSALKASDYKISFDGSNYSITRLSDNTQVSTATAAQLAAGVTVDGVQMTIGAGSQVAGDQYVVKPTINAASGFKVLVTDVNNIAAASPISTSTPLTNSGSGTISAGKILSTSGVATITPGFPLTYNDAATIPVVGVSANANNAGDAVLNATVSNSGVLTGSGYKVVYDSSVPDYAITRLSDSVVAHAPILPTTVDGIKITQAFGTPQDGDNFVVSPPSAKTLTGFPAGIPVTVTDINGNTYAYAAGQPVAYMPGATITVGGASFSINGALKTNDQFLIGPNQTTSGDNRNMVALGTLQTADTLANGTTTYQGALAQMVSMVGNKTHELQVGKDAQTNLVSQLEQAQDADSGVNLDEEGANLLRYQQAYVAAGKVMQAVKEMFDTLVALGQG